MRLVNAICDQINRFAMGVKQSMKPLMPASKIDRYLKTVGVRLELTRRALGLSQTEFAARAGIASNTYNQFERGQRVPSVKAALMMCDAHHLTLDWIFADDPSNLKYQLADAIRALAAANGGN